MIPLLLGLGAALAGADAPPSFVVFLTDDQRADSLWAMPSVQRELVDQGVRFDRAYVTCPLCAPTRASLLSGGFTPGHTQVLANTTPSGGALQFTDATTLATRLQQRGYATGLVGKYLNDYEDLAPRVPPGWTHFEVVQEYRSWTDLDLIVGSSEALPTEGTPEHWDRYVTTEQTASALDFLDEHHDQPFLLLISYLAPHYPAQPLPEDEGHFSEYTFHSEAWDEADVSDKPAWVQALPRLDEATVEQLDHSIHRHLDTLPAVDRSVGAVLAHLQALGIDDHTAVFFLSDNGLAWGEHRMVLNKGAIYEESARVPFVARLPGVEPRREDALVAAELDLPATLLDLAGDHGPTDGISLAPLLRGEAAAPRDHLRLQVWEAANRPPWVGMVAPSWKATLLGTDETELYSRAEDPWELDSVHADPEQAERLAALHERLLGEAELSLLERVLPSATAGQPYEHALRTWGGEPPLSFQAGEGLPPGLVLSEAGTLAGTPTEAGLFRVKVEVTDRSVSPQSGRPQSHTRWMELEVLDGGDSGDTGHPDTGGPPSSADCGCHSTSIPWGLWTLGLLLTARRRRLSPLPRSGPPTRAAPGRPPWSGRR